MRWVSLLLIFLSLNIFGQEAGSQSTSGKILTIGSITLVGNKITHDNIILREIEFSPGEKMTEEELDLMIEKSRQNLLNRSLFNFVTIHKSENNGTINIEVNVVERWYIWPIPILNTAGRNLNAWWETKDFGRLNYGVDLKVDNFRRRMEKLNIIVQGGFDQTLAAKWTIPYLTKKQFLGIGIGGGYQRNREVIVATVDNKPQYYESMDGYAQQRAFGVLDFTLRPKFNFLHTFTIGFDHYNFQDTLLQINPDYAFEAVKYDFITLSYLYKLDFRDFKPYPLNGLYFDVGVKKQGLGLAGNDIDTWSASFVFDQYINLYKRWYFAYSLSSLFTSSGKKPYFLTPAFGYIGMEIRGYELYIINGQNFGLFKSNIKFEIIPQTVKRIKWIKSEKFGKVFYALYANLFFDLGYAYDDEKYGINPLANQLLWGTGVGIDFVTYYDLVIRFEYTINKQGDHGFFLNLVAPI